MKLKASKHYLTYIRSRSVKFRVINSAITRLFLITCKPLNETNKYAKTIVLLSAAKMPNSQVKPKIGANNMVALVPVL